MEFLETTKFTERITALMSDDLYKELQFELIINPKKGDVIRSSGGLRKMRWHQKDRGKRGGVRIIYYIASDDKILMLLAYKKNEYENLTPEQIKILRSLVDYLHNGKEKN